MLLKLKIQNYALIEDIEINFQKGLTVITGETGAGKSILLGALSLILGNRADRSMFKDQTKKCIIEGLFSINGYQLESFFEDHDLDFENETVIRREINAQGKSRIFINDTPASLESIKQLGDSLLDVHSQNQSLKINDFDFQLDLIDSMSNSLADLVAYQKEYELYKALHSEYEQTLIKLKEDQKEEDYLKFQLDELENLKLKEDEEPELEEEYNLLSNGEVLIQQVQEANNLLSESEINVRSLLNQVRQNLSQISNINPTFKELHDRLQSNIIDLEDINIELERFSSDFEFSPERLQYIDNRLSEIHRIKKKHFVSEANELIKIQGDLALKLNQITNSDEYLKSLKAALDEKHKSALQLAESLSSKRKKSISSIQKNIDDTLKFLEIPNARFIIDHQKNENIGLYGIDHFDFLFSANKGLEPVKIAKAASGGEVSRLVLAIKNLIANHKKLPTILFDEIDTGVSGEIANKMGDLLKQMGQNRQVISITHLPQIAAKGENHLYVYKEDKANKTISNLKKLTNTERVEELAKMLSGKTITEAALNNAKELILNS